MICHLLFLLSSVGLDILLQNKVGVLSSFVEKVLKPILLRGTVVKFAKKFFTVLRLLLKWVAGKSLSFWWNRSSVNILIAHGLAHENLLSELLPLALLNFESFALLQSLFFSVFNVIFYGLLAHHIWCNFHLCLLFSQLTSWSHADLGSTATCLPSIEWTMCALHVRRIVVLDFSLKIIRYIWFVKSETNDQN